MGVHDEHWCSRCHKALDKVEETYYNVDVVNPPEPDPDDPAAEQVHNRIFLCEKCYAEEEGLREAVERLRKRGNPTFSVNLHCASAGECEDFQPSDDPCVNCQFIYALRDQLYCGRRHPGAVTVNVDKAAIDQDTMERLGKYFNRLVGQDMRVAVGEMFDLVNSYSQDDLRDRTPHVIIPGKPEPYERNFKIIMPGDDEEIPQFSLPLFRKPGPLNNGNAPS